MSFFSRITLLLVVLLLFFQPLAYGQTKNDSLAIRATALDFIEGWYQADPQRFRKSLHEDMISKVVTSYGLDSSRMQKFDVDLLVRLTQRGGGSALKPADRRKEVEILDIYQNAASVKVLAYDAMEYLHMAKWKGEWKIINILFERTKK